jgi:hypothetical protein
MRKAVFVLAIILVILFSANVVFAGFGISPPYVISDRLYPGAHFEQKIVLSRGDPKEDLKAKITIDAPEIESWFSFEPGKEFLLPKGSQQVVMMVKVDVPRDAEYKNYKGYIYVRTAPAKEEKKAGIAILLGARVDIDLTVTEFKIIDFKIRNLRIPDSEEGFHWWKVELPGKIKFLMNVENIGNVEAAPNRVAIEIYDLTLKNLLYQGENKSLKNLEPFKRKDVVAEFFHRLKPGQYWSMVKVFKDEEGILREEKILLTVTPMEMSRKDWVVVAGIILGTLIVLGIVVKTKVLAWWKRKVKQKRKVKI